jgi:hypothetical protein
MQSHSHLRGGIDAAAEQQEQRQRQIAAYAELVRRGQMEVAGIHSTYRDAVREYLTRNSEMTPQQFHAKQEAERRKFYLSRATQGHKAQRVSQHDHDFIVGSIFGSVDSGAKPAVRPMLEAYSEERGYSPEWAKRVSVQTHPKKMGTTLAAKKDHPVLKDLKEGHLSDPQGSTSERHIQRSSRTTVQRIANSPESAAHAAGDRRATDSA